MSYEGVKYKSIFIDDKIPDYLRINELRHWCKVFHENDLAPYYPGGTHGNMSFRIKPDSNSFVITSARSSFAAELPDDSFFTVFEVDMDAATLSVSGSKKREPSSEAILHYAIYQKRPDVQAILHGHCKTISQHSEKMDIPTTKEFVESGTMKIVHSVVEILGNHPFIEIKDHGFMSMGESIEEAGELSMEMLIKSNDF